MWVTVEARGPVRSGGPRPRRARGLTPRFFSISEAVRVPLHKNFKNASFTGTYHRCECTFCAVRTGAVRYAYTNHRGPCARVGLGVTHVSCLVGRPDGRVYTVCNQHASIHRDLMELGVRVGSRSASRPCHDRVTTGLESRPHVLTRHRIR